ncbi:hypothetical protein L810_7108 [Burkholderia sp. AU4i]|nr:hypothetical protein L810_7108 [Burkholderia sp. AU4i]
MPLFQPTVQLVFWLFQVRLLAAVNGPPSLSISMRDRSCRTRHAENEIISAVVFRIRNDTDTASIRWESPRIIRIFRNNPENGSGLSRNTPVRPV